MAQGESRDKKVPGPRELAEDKRDMVSRKEPYRSEKLGRNSEDRGKKRRWMGDTAWIHSKKRRPEKR